jgi:hypothetical protein
MEYVIILLAWALQLYVIYRIYENAKEGNIFK